MDMLTDVRRSSSARTMLKTLKRFAAAFAIVAFVMASMPSAFAYYSPRMGAYTGYARGMYDYVSPPVSTYRYSAPCNIVGVRDPVYPTYPCGRQVQIYRPNYGDCPGCGGYGAYDYYEVSFGGYYEGYW